MIFLSQTFLDSSIEASDHNINIPRYNSLGSDHPSNTRRGGVFMFYKDYVPAIRRNDLCASKECIVTEIKLGKNQYFLVAISQTPNEFENNCQNFYLTLSNIDDTSPFCSTVLGDFNARCKNWWAGDVNSNAGKELYSLNSIAWYTQVIDKLTHLFSGGSSCIDLILCNKPEIVNECRISHSLFQTCHANMLFPLSYSTEGRHYKIANVEGIKKSISLFNRENVFENLSVKEKVGFLNNTLLNIFFNYIASKIIKCRYRSPLSII